MPNCYVLVDRVPVLEPDFERWCAWRHNDDCRVGHDHIGGVLISTVFLGIDHSPLRDGSRLFETVIFGGTHDKHCQQCVTWADAEAQHQQALAMVRTTLH
jgi:hypothetical protein